MRHRYFSFRDPPKRIPASSTIIISGSLFQKNITGAGGRSHFLRKKIVVILSIIISAVSRFPFPVATIIQQTNVLKKQFVSEMGE